MILLAKKGVDGVYDSDPNLNSDAKKYSNLSYREILNQNLKIMDGTATTLCMDNDIPLIVFGIDEEDAMYKVVCGENIGTNIK